ncbi:beta-galactosidase [Lachnospiraceae bacterium OttesenSCG-928-D06]|nr:beta-galactosidase [Lachnospiraceae bacterium OttesenSCG-928-D06]
MKTTFNYNNQHLIKDGNPWFPVMGEMHYSRYQKRLWEESLRKMKAGGLNIVSSYQIWIHHEEVEGVFDFSGCRDLKEFLHLCQKVGLYVFLRLGPWVHGEVRNGGFPDWLLKKEGITLRSDEESYLAYVRRYWEQIYVQAKGMMLQDGGPVIGIQIENEYGHVGGLQGEAGEKHMRTLTAMAQEIGFQVPLYTATGWGGAHTGGLIPVMGGYCEAPWDQSIGELAANPNYVFSKVRNDALIACDHHVDESVTFDEKDFPFLTAELGGGLQVTRHRRPVATGSDIGAMSLTKLGSGAALLGYYMYHGGSNPKGVLSTLQESTATGYLNDLPEINYDFNAPIRQYGTISDSYREVRLLSYFLQDFGSDLATLQVTIEPENIHPEDNKTLRLSYRHDGEHGYIFFNNYQRRRTMSHHTVTLTGKYCTEEVVFPEVSILAGQYGFFPYHMKLGTATLKSALAVPLCRLDTASDMVFVFYGDWEPNFKWASEETAKIIHLSRADACHCAKVKLDQDYLILSEGYAYEKNGTLVVSGLANTRFKSFPKLTTIPSGFKEWGEDGEFFVYERQIRITPPEVSLTISEEKDEYTTYELSMDYKDFSGSRAEGQDILLSMAYAGESMEIYRKDEKINDYFYTGQKALLSLGYFDFPDKLQITVYPLHEEDKIFLEKWPEMKKGKACEITKISLQVEY